MKMDITNLGSFLEKANKAYRTGNPIISDKLYDDLLETWGNQNISKLDDGVYGEVKELPHKMGSLNKLKNLEEIKKWLDGFSGELEITPKLDGISNLVGMNSAMTRGRDGINGTIVTNNFKYIKNHDLMHINGYMRGELVIDWETFENVFIDEGYSHPRNAVAGLFNNKTPNKDLLKHVTFVPFNGFGIYEEYAKRILTDLGLHKVLCSIYDIHDDLLFECFEFWKSKYPIDGLVIKKLGTRDDEFETNSLNPKNSRAYKHNNFTSLYNSEVLEVHRQISKEGICTPVLEIIPTEVDGAVISRIHADNEKFVKVFGIGKGTKISFIRSGGIIPRLMEVEDIPIPNRKHLLPIMKKRSIEGCRNYITNGLFEIKNNYNEPEFEYNWDGIFMKVADENNRESKIRKLLHFTKTIGAKEFGMSVLSYLFDSYGVIDVESLIQFNFDVLKNTAGYGAKKVEGLKKSITESLSNIEEHRLMAATGFFPKLGKSKLKIYLTEGVEGEGLGEKAKEIIEKGESDWERFKSIFKWNTIKPEKDGNFSGNIYCATKCRIKGELLESVIENGHKVLESYNKDVTHLVVLDETVSTTKTKKAIKDGKKIITMDQLKKEFEKGETVNEDESLF